MFKELIKELNKEARPQKAKDLAWYFKTGPGEYGEGDAFLGITVPIQRKIAKKYTNLSLSDIQRLLDSKYHEHRLTALLILVDKYENAREDIKKKIVDFYLLAAKRGRINNWDLVDLSAPKIVGNYLLDREVKILYNLAKSENLWERRITVLSTFSFIKEKKYNESLKLARVLISDKEDLIHKAVGWMLREIGKRNKKEEINFLNKYYKKMPRVMLRYAIEKLNKKERLKYLEK